MVWPGLPGLLAARICSRTLPVVTALPVFGLIELGGHLDLRAPADRLRCAHGVVILGLTGRCRGGRDGTRRGGGAPAAWRPAGRRRGRDPGTVRWTGAGRDGGAGSNVRSCTVERSLRHACEVSCRVRAGRLPGRRWRLHPKVLRRPPRAADRARDRIWVPRPCPRMPVWSFAITGRADRTGAGLGVVRVGRDRRAGAHRPPLLPDIRGRSLGVDLITERVWHSDRCPVCNRAVTNADARA